MRRGKVPVVSNDETDWLSTQEAARRLGITPRTLYRFIDHGELPAYRFGRVIRLRGHEVEAFIVRSRIQPGELEHLYPEPAGRAERVETIATQTIARLATSRTVATIR